MPKRKQKCVVKTCKRTDITAHGNCNACYQSNKRLVDLRRTTWEKLIAQGKALPLGANRKRNKARVAESK